MKTRVLLSLALIFSAVCMNVKAIDPVKDPYSYHHPKIGESIYTLTNKWIYSIPTANYGTVAGFELATTSANVRQMVYKDGKLLFGSRDTGAQILVVDAATGALGSPVTLAANVFQKTDGSGATGYECNDIRIDDAGHVLVGNIKLANAVFQIWNIDLATGNGTLVIEAGASSIAAADRFDCFTVMGDVTKNATIFAVASSSTAASLNMYRWKISNGVAAEPELILIDFTAGGFPSAVVAVGSSPCAFPVTEDLVYLDGTATYPTLMQITGDPDEGYMAVAVDAFYDITNSSLPIPNFVDETTEPGKQFGMQPSLNGLARFSIGNEFFFVFGIRAHGALTDYEDTPKQSFRLFKFRNADQKLREAEILWTFPQAGLGNATGNSAYLAPVAVNVQDNTATIYIYSLANGFGAYEFTVNKNVGITLPTVASLQIIPVDKMIQFSETIASTQVYNLAGQLVAQKANTNEINVVASGIYVVKAVTLKGETVVSKVIVK